MHTIGTCLFFMSSPVHPSDIQQPEELSLMRPREQKKKKGEKEKEGEGEEHDITSLSLTAGNH